MKNEPKTSFYGFAIVYFIHKIPIFSGTRSLVVFFRYVVRNLLGYFFICLVFCVGLFILFDFIDKSKYYFPAVNSDSWSIFLYYLYQVPYLCIQSAPLASLAASTFTLYALGSSNEMISMLSFAYPPARLLRPLLFSGLIILTGLFAISEFVVPETAKKVQYLRKAVFEGRKNSFINKAKWSREGNTFYSYSVYKPETNRFHALKIIHLNKDFTLKEVEEVQEARYIKAKELWKFKGVKTYHFIREQENFSVKEEEKKSYYAQLPLSEDLMKVERRLVRELSLQEISTIINRNKTSGMNLIDLHIAWHTKLAYLSASFLFIFGAFPLAFRFGRRKETVLDFLSLLALGFGYWLLFSFLRAVLLSGSIHIPIGSWLPNLILLAYLSATVPYLAVACCFVLVAWIYSVAYLDKHIKKQK